MWNVEATKTVTVAASPVECWGETVTADGHRILQYAAYSGNNVRGGAIQMVWSRQANRVEWNDVTTDDIGTATALTFTAWICGDRVRLDATSSSGTWTVNLLAICHERSN